MSAVDAQGLVVLTLPQWQGYGADDGPQRGALAIAAAWGPAERRHQIAVPAWHALAGPLAGLDEIVRQAQETTRWLAEATPHRLLVIAGDCGSDLAPMAWQSARHGSDLGVLYLDAHADLNTPESSPSGRFHGMVLRAALGDGAPAIQALCPCPLAAEQVILAGGRDFDPAERDFLDTARITLCSPAAVSDGGALAAVLAHRARCWHVHLDLDVLDPTDFPDVTVPTPGGPDLAAVARLLSEVVSQREVVSITVAEHVGGATSARRVVAALRGAGWC